MIVAWIFGIYAAIIILFNMPFMQRNLADWTANTLSKQLNTKVEIGSINVSLLNRIIVNDLHIEDQNKKEMLKVARVSTSINLFTLITKGNIDISTAQLFGTKANLYKKTPEDKLNCQFVIDAFQSDDTESKPINLRINSLIVRHANISYDVLSESKKTILDPNHIKIENAGFNLSIKTFTPDSLNVALKRFQAKEANSNLSVKELAFRIEANNDHAVLTDFAFRLPNTSVEIDSTEVHYKDFSSTKTFSFGNTDIAAAITPSDFSFVSSSLSNFDETIDINTTISGINNSLEISKLLLNNKSNTLSANIVGNINDLAASKPQFNIAIKSLDIAEDAIRTYTHLLGLNEESLTPLYNVGDIKFTGNIAQQHDDLVSDGELNTAVGNVTYTAKLNQAKLLDAEIDMADINVQHILDDDKFGTANFHASALLDLSATSQIPLGSIEGTITNFTYNGYDYKDIDLHANSTPSDLVVKAISEDENINVDLEGTLSNINDAYKNIAASLNVHNINPHILNLTDKMVGESYSFALNTDMNFADINHLKGSVSLDDITIKTTDGIENIQSIVALAKIDDSSDQTFSIKSDILDCDITGRFSLLDLPKDFQNIIAHHLPALVKRTPSSTDSDFKYDLTFYDAPIVHHFVDIDYSVSQPITVRGSLNTSLNHLNTTFEAPQFTYNDHQFNDVTLNCNSSKGNIMLTLMGKNNGEDSKLRSKIVAIAHDNKVDTDIQLDNEASNHIKANIFGTTSFADNNGHLKTTLKLVNSNVTINDTIWHITPSTITYCNNLVECNKFRIGYANQYLEINGRASQNPNDSLIVQLNDIEVSYILDLIKFDDVKFGGRAFGHAKINNIFGKPDANVNLTVHDFSLQHGIMGDASILAFWDKEKDGINVHANFVDHYKSQLRLSGIMEDVTGITTADGYILPAKNEMDLKVHTNNTRADFLEGFLGSVISDIDGRINGDISVVGSFSDLNIIGDAKVDMSMKLNATNVPYFISDSVHLRYHAFDLSDITLHDRYGNTGHVNGNLTHKNLGNFMYKFDAELNNLCAYDETTFNSDKFMAQVWANGDIHVNGSDGHPLVIEANVTPTKGSMFAYDSATPDALISNSFIDFNDITEKEKIKSETSDAAELSPSRSTNKSEEKEYSYHGDIYMDVNIDLTPNCEIKLRMDNTPDGYISTFGHGIFQAKWYNKGAFQLFGNYNITSGKYRLYLQDLVYRNLELQDGSKVEFNGNPFDANIHLICKHEINSVPLSDLTATKAFSSNNKVKVDCFLDITGHLDKMDLSFKFELPNVSEETRQLVRSMINSDEEMNKQMIYLLGFQRFYPNQLAQSNIEDYGTQAVNSLISSTISGQINQVLSNMIGSSSKWNFGTGITTGENGWEDLDVEGILSGRLLNDRLLINGNFGYRDNSLTNQANFIGDFELKYRIWETGDFYAKAYNQTNDRYFTKATLNTQGIGLSFQHDFERYTLFNIFRRKQTEKNDSIKVK